MAVAIDELTSLDHEIQIIDRLGEVEDETAPPEYSITSYGADYIVDVLISRLERGDIHIPSYQRRYVWNQKKASRFIESLLLGLPVPGIFLAKEGDTQRHLVIDGQQRLTTLRHFYEGVFQPTQKSFTLIGVPTRFKGLTYRSLRDEDRRRLNDSIIHATIVKQDDPSDDGNSSIYHIFERLNTGGVLLLPQEIRSSLFHGQFAEVLKELNEIAAWRNIYGPTPSPRMRDQELILRFLAFYFYQSDYRAPMKEFLNRYMGKNRNLEYQGADHLRDTFVPTIELIAETIGTKAFKPGRALNAAVFDSVMVGMARRLERGAIKDHAMLRSRYEVLLEDKQFLSGITRATANEQRVQDRFDAAVNAFSELQ